MARGFTLMETVIMIALVALIFLIGIPLSFTFFRNQSTAATAEVIATEIRRAQTEAHAQTDDSAHGVYVFTDRLVRFEGSSYASRVTAKDVVVEFSGDIAHSGDNEIVFPVGSLSPLAPASMTLTAGSLAYDITVSAYGVVEVTQRAIAP